MSRANANDVRYLPLLFVVLAIAVRLAPESIAGHAKTRRLKSVRYYWCCKRAISRTCVHFTNSSIPARRALLMAAAVQQESLDMVLTRLLVFLIMVAVFCTF
jgi:hypothetical protein